MKSSQQCVHISLFIVFLSLHVHVDDTWWNPEKLKEDSRAYLRLLIGLFEMILSGADAIHFRVLMKLFIKVLGSSFSGILFPLKRYSRAFLLWQFLMKMKVDF